MGDKSFTELNNTARRVYERALQRFDDANISIAKMESLIDKQTTSADKNPSSVSGTYLDKKNPYCPLNLCDATRAVVIDEGDDYEPGTVIQCPCVKPTSLREYQNQKPKELG